MQLTEADLAAWPRRRRAALVNSLSGFKSANLLGTRSADGQENLAIISSVFHLGADPALAGMILRPHSVDRHSLEYLLETGVYTLNQVHEGIHAAAHQTSARYPRTVSEFDAVGLTPEYRHGFAAPFVGESRIKLGLRLEDSQTLKVNDTVLVIGRIEQILVAEDAWVGEDGYLDIEAAGTVAVSGLDGYHRATRLARLPYAKP